MGSVDGGIQIGVGKHHVGTLATKFKGEPLHRVGCFTLNNLGGRQFSGEGDFVDPGMLHNRGPRGRPVAGHHVDNAVGNARLLRQTRHAQA